TLPFPVIAAATCTVAFTNVAVDVVSAPTERTQDGAVPEQAPVQLENAKPIAGTAITDTVAPLSSESDVQPVSHGSFSVPERATSLPEPSSESENGNCGRCSSHAESCTSHHEPLCA